VLLPAAGALQVNQDPGEVQVMEGDRVALECQMLTTEPWERLRLEWVKEQEELCTIVLNRSSPAPHVRCPLRLHPAWNTSRATLSLQPARGGDAGLYLCRVTLEI
ncbi:TMIG2 protein, partial [Tricholaema leucomelas]|nr:TMIG2 protein [Tricholaema leucomelas]